MASSPIAVVAMAGLFPGSATLDGFWQGIVDGRCSAAPVPEHRWPVGRDELLAAAPVPPGRLLGTRACLLDPFDLGPDAAGLDLDLARMARLDPLVRLVLRVGSQAWARTSTADVDPSRVAVVLANIALPTETGSRLTREVLGRALEERLSGATASASSELPLGTDPLSRWVTALPAGLLARGLGLGGGSYTLDAACASSLYALHLACEDLRSGRNDLVLAGGVHRSDCLYTQLGFSQLRALSPSGRCAPFDSRGDGLVVGEGAGIFALKRLDDALAQGDEILGLVHAVGLANDVGGSLLAPDSEGQRRAMRHAYERSGWSPDGVDLVECHGTGTPAGDRTELASIGATFGDSAAVIGSVKSNVGHLLTGAGAAGFAKVLLALRHRVLPPTANFSPDSALPELADGPLEVLTEPRDWPDPGRPRRAAVSAFGFGGIDAHLLVEEWTNPRLQPRLFVAPPAPEPVAIVGLGARFGGLLDKNEFGRAALAGEPALGPRPLNRWKGVDRSAWMDDVAGDLGALPGAWIDDVSVPVGRFRIAPNEISGTLPQQLLMLQVAADAVDDCSVQWSPAQEDRLRAGVIVGLGLDLETTSFHLGWSMRSWARRAAPDLDPDDESRWTEAVEASAGPLLDRTRTLGALGSIAASRIARELRLGGPSFAISAEEASGLRCLEVAVRMLQRGEVDSMIAGAVDLAGDVRAVLATDRVRPWSRGGVPRPLDHRADGAVPGEGAAAVVLKRLSDAQRDGDRIYAVIKGIGAATDWAHALDRAWSEAGAAPASAGLIETAASGFAAEDRDEARALADALGTASAPRTAVVAVRSVVGDPGAAGGMASLVRGCLALHHGVLPAAPGFERPADLADWTRAGMHAPRVAQPWVRDRAAGPRRAGVSASSTDGSLLHVVLEGTEESAAAWGPRRAGLVVCGEAEVATLRAFVEARLDRGVEEVAAAWFRLRGSASGQAFVADSTDGLLRRIDRPGPPVPRLDGELAWVFPGSGAHHLGMGSSLLAAFPHLAHKLDGDTEHLAAQLAADAFTPWRADWSGDWEADANDRLANDPRRVIFGQVSHGATMGRALAWLGVRPSAVIGYSLGESAGLFASRGWRERDLMFERLLASPLFVDQLAGECTVAQAAYDTDTPDWVAVVVDRSADQVREHLNGTVRLLIVNAPGECVLGGRRDEVLAVAERLGATASEPLAGVPTVHSDLLDPVADAYRALHVLPTTPPPGVRYYSGNLGRSYDLTPEAAADSIVANATRGLDFQATIEQAWADGVRIFVEGGPQGTCCRMIDRILGDRPHLAVAAGQRGVDGPLALLRCVGKLISAGVSIDLAPLYGEASGVWTQTPADPRPAVRVELGGDPPPAPSVPRPRAPLRPPIRPAVSPAPLAAAAPAGALVANTAGLLSGAMHAANATTAAHGEYLAFSTRGRELAEGLARSILALQGGAEPPGLRTDLATTRNRGNAGAGAGAEACVSSEARSVPQGTRPGRARQARKATQNWGRQASAQITPEPELFMTREACMEFAIGSIAKVLGPEFAPADTFPTRVRLPDEPLMLVDRVLSVEGEPRTMGGGRVVTEHDVLPGAWYLDGGRAPTCISVEAGQADLFLSGYLGIDLQTKGERVYRLLDAEVTFHRDLPRVGETVRYDIRIRRFIRQGSTWMFFFSFEGWIGDEHLITMADGCAGFFSTEQLASGRGLVEDDPSEIPPRRPGTTPLRPLVPMRSQTLDDAQVDALRTGDLQAAFGPEFAGRTLAPRLRLPGGRMRLVHRVTELEPDGGNYGLGRITAETDVEPTAWYLTCHFVDDMVMPGTLMYEGCAHTLRVLLMRLGWVVDEAEDDVHFAPVVGESSALRCRGQVLDTTKTLTYRIDLKEVGYDPEPYVLADAVMFADGRKIVRFLNVAYRISGLDEATITAGWQRPAADVLFTKDQILAFAEGNPSDCFGPAFARFDDGTRLARLPRPPYAFLDRVTSIGYPPLAMKESTDWSTFEWDVDPDAWYFAAGRSRSIPFAVLLEAALQPCGFISSHVGSALTAEGLYYRNLGGRATLHFDPRNDIGTIVTRSRLDSISQAGGMILNAFTLDMHADGRLLYEGTTRFGFFPPDAMADQVGLRGAKHWTPDGDLGGLPIDPVGPTTPDDASALGAPDREHLGLPAPVWTMIDRVDAYVVDGGPSKQGWISGSMDVDPDTWFFRAHFFQDPVIPGSLGLESFLQLLQVVALQRWPHLRDTHRFEPIAVGRAHEWQYRGQVVPTQSRVQVDAWIDSVEEGDEPVLTGSGLLSVDGRDIYSMSGFALRLVRVD